MKSSTNRGSGGMVASLVLMTAAAAGLLLWQSAEFRETGRRKAVAEKRLLQSQAVWSTIQNAAIATRGYLLTKDEEFLTPFVTAVERMDGDLERLAAFVDGNVAQAHRVEQLKELITRDLARQNQLLLLSTNGHLELARDYILSPAGSQNLEAIREVSEEFQAEERKGSLSETDQIMGYDRRTVTLLGAWIGLAGLLLVACLVRLRRSPARDESVDGVLPRAEECLRLVSQSTGQLVWEWNLKNDRIEWFGSINRMLDIPEGGRPQTGAAFFERIHSDDVKSVRESVDRHLAGGASVSVEFRIRSGAGGYRTWMAHAYAIAGSDGKPARMVGSCADVSQRRLAEDKFKGLLEFAPDAIVIVDCGGKIVEANAAAERQFGYTRAELLGERMELFIPRRMRASNPVQHELFSAGAASPPNGGAGMDLMAVRKNGSEFPVELTLAPLETENGLLVSCAIRDVTQRRKMQDQLQQSEQRYRTIVESVEEGILTADKDFRITFANSQIARLFGCQAGEMDGRSPSDFMDEEARVVFENQAKRLSQNGSVRYDLRLRRRDGETIWTMVSASPLRDVDGSLVGSMAVVSDITARKKAEEQLHELNEQLARRVEERTRELTESQQRLHQTILSAPIPMMVFDEDGRVLEMSQGWTEYSGYSREDIRSALEWMDRACGDQKAKAAECLRQLHQIEQTVDCGEWDVQAKNGENRVWEFHATPIGQDSKERRLLLMTAVDVTERKLAEKSLWLANERFELAVRGANDGLWDWDIPTGDIYLSDRWCALLGYQQGEIPHQIEEWHSRLHPDERESVLERFHLHLEHDTPFDITFRLRSKGGKYRWFRARGQAIRNPDGKAMRMAGSITDISEQKGAEEQNRQLNQTLERRVAERTAELVSANETLRRQIMERQRVEEQLARTNQDLRCRQEEIQNFYHTLSHELKTPLTAAREFVSIVIDGLAGPINSTQEDYLCIARVSCDQMRVCLNDLLDAARLDTGKLALEIQPVSLGTLVQRVATTFVSAVEEKGIRMATSIADDLPDVALDESRITQVLNNLIGNALKFTPANGCITVRVNPSPQRSGFVQVSVADTGRGIDSEKLPRIFDRLFQVQPGDAANDRGLGLGLFICKELVELHGGRIWAESRIGRGTTLFFELPMHATDGRGRVLVIDGDGESLDLLREHLEREGFRVMTASSGRQALTRIEQQKPEMVLLDTVMPASDGFDTFREIQRRWPSLPVILQTEQPEGDSDSRARGLAPAGSVAKSSPLSEFVETIEKVRQAAGLGQARHARSVSPASSVADRGAVQADENILQP